MSREPSGRRASTFEILGAWLKLWTPPRDVDVPPVPVRKLAIGGVLALAVLGGVAALAVPRIDAAKERTDARERAERAVRIAAERRRVIAEQRPRRSAVADLRPPASAGGRERLAARAALLARAERAITLDAQERVARGELDGRPSRTECESHLDRPAGEGPQADLSSRRGIYDCLVVVRDIRATATNGPGLLGYPFRAVLDFRAFSFTWCKTNPVPGERAIPDPRMVVRLPRECRAPRDLAE